MGEPAIPETVNVKKLNRNLGQPIYAQRLNQEKYGAIINWTSAEPNLLSWDVEQRLGHLAYLSQERAFLAKKMPYSRFGFKINFGSEQQLTTNNVKTKVLTLHQGVQTEVELITLAPLGIGQSVDFCFPISESEWIDPSTGFLYFKPSGKTFGNIGSFADLIYDDKLKSLFYRLHQNNHLQLYDKNGIPVTKTTSASDWSALCQLKLPYYPGAATYAAGSAGTGETNWDVGVKTGSSKYIIPLVHHAHDLTQTPHNHNIIQEPHSHNLEGYPYDAEAGEGNDGSGSAFAPVSNKTRNTSINITMSPESVNLTIAAAGGDDKLIVQTLGYGVEKMIFTGVKL